MKKFLLDSQGSALALVLVVMVVLTILGTAALNLSLAETKFAVRDEQMMRAEYIAKAGLDSVAKHYSNNSTTTTMLTGTVGDGTFTVTKVDTANGIKLTSVGQIGTTISKTMTLTMESTASAQNLLKNVLYSEQSLNLTAFDYGNFSGDFQSGGSITLPGTTAQQDAYKANYDVEPNKSLGGKTVTVPSFTPSTPSTISSNTITQDGYYGSYTINKNDTLHIVTSGIKKIIVFDSLTCEGNIEIDDNGRVEIYIKESLTLGYANPKPDNSNFNNTPTANTSNLTVFIKDDPNDSVNDCEFKGGYFNGYLIGPQAEFLMHNKAYINGAIFVNSFTTQSMNGHDKYLFYNPPEDDLDFGSALTSSYVRLMYNKE